MFEVGYEGLGWGDSEAVAENEDRFAAVFEAQMQIGYRVAAMTGERGLQRVEAAIVEAGLGRADSDLAHGIHQRGA